MKWRKHTMKWLNAPRSSSCPLHRDADHSKAQQAPPVPGRGTGVHTGTSEGGRGAEGEDYLQRDEDDSGADLPSVRQYVSLAPERNKSYTVLGS